MMERDTHSALVMRFGTLFLLGVSPGRCTHSRRRVFGYLVGIMHFAAFSNRYFCISRIPHERTEDTNTTVL